MITKKTILIAGMLLFFGFAPHVLAEGFVALAPIPGLTDPSALSAARSTNLASFFNNLYKFAIGMAAALAVIMIIWGGLEYSTQDSISKKSDGKQRIYNAILGLVLVLSPVLVFSIINPAILNLSINLEKLDTRSGPQVPANDASVPYTVGTGPSCNGLINAGRDCTQTIFREDTYASPPRGAWCYRLATQDNGKGYNCYRNQNGCVQGCATTCGSYLAPTTCPATQAVCNTGCVIGI